MELSESTATVQYNGEIIIRLRWPYLICIDREILYGIPSGIENDKNKQI